MSSPRVLAIIPARGGSKGLIHKNVVKLGGQPLIAYTLQALAEARLVTDHIVSTDDPVIAKTAERFGGSVPYLRPAHLAEDDSLVTDVVMDILSHTALSYEYLLLLQPTSPLRVAADIDAAITLADERDATSVVSLTLMETYHPWNMYYLKEDHLQPVGSRDHAQPRQQYPVVGWRNGAIYLVKRGAFLQQHVFVTDDCVPYLMPLERSVNIDTGDDLWLAERYLQERERSTSAGSLRPL